MTDREAMLAAIRSSPGDNTPLLIFADWCEEHGEERLATLIRTKHRPVENVWKRYFWFESGGAQWATRTFISYGDTEEEATMWPTLPALGDEYPGSRIYIERVEVHPIEERRVGEPDLPSGIWKVVFFYSE